jgi:hypothetical protein
MFRPQHLESACRQHRNLPHPNRNFLADPLTLKEQHPSVSIRQHQVTPQNMPGSLSVVIPGKLAIPQRELPRERKCALHASLGNRQSYLLVPIVHAPHDEANMRVATGTAVNHLPTTQPRACRKFSIRQEDQALARRPPSPDELVAPRTLTEIERGADPDDFRGGAPHQYRRDPEHRQHRELHAAQEPALVGSGVANLALSPPLLSCFPCAA